MQRYPMRLKPYISETVWGGRRLVSEYGIDPQGHANCAEAWMLSAHPNGSSVVQNGAYAGMPLAELYDKHPELFGQDIATRFPILVKFIDAQDDLSIQVHPRDSDPVLLPGEAGKTECWYILDAQPGAKLYLGFREAILQDEFAWAIQNNTLMDFVQPFEVHAGEFYYIPAGTLHAIGRGVLLVEVQQNSDTTYRIYDYGRLQNGQPRQLHIEQALAVTELDAYKPEPMLGDWKRKGLRGRALVSNAYFTVEEFESKRSCGRFMRGTEDDSFTSLLFLEGADILLRSSDGDLLCNKGDSVLIPAGLAYAVEGKGRVLVTEV